MSAITDESEVELGGLKAFVPLIAVIYIDEIPGCGYTVPTNDFEAFMHHIRPKYTGYIVRRISGDPISGAKKKRSEGLAAAAGFNNEDADLWGNAIFESYQFDMDLISRKPHFVYIFSGRMTYGSYFGPLPIMFQGAYAVHKQSQELTGFKSLSFVSLKTLDTAFLFFGVDSIESAITSCCTLTITKTFEGRAEHLVFEFYDRTLVDYNEPSVAPPDAIKTDHAIEYILIFFEYLSKCFDDFDSHSDSARGFIMGSIMDDTFTVINSSHLDPSAMEESRHFFIKIVSGDDMITVSSEMISVYLRYHQEEGFDGYFDLHRIYELKYDLIERLVDMECLPILLKGGPSTNARISNTGVCIDPEHRPLFPLNNVVAVLDTSENDRVPWCIY